jgi:large subunit ribosomal protein L15
MIELHNLSPDPGSHRKRKRVGRGPGSGTGKTAGRGQKGQKARSGASIPAGFEGGQMPLQRRIPKGGFTPLNRVEFHVVNVRDIHELEETEITVDVLRARGLIGSKKQPLKILGTGDLKRAVKVTAHAFSSSAREKIEAAGGTATVIGSETA